jgi:hypothetical protein
VPKAEHPALGGKAGYVVGDPRDGIAEVILGDDVVAVEHRPGAVSGYPRGHRLGDPGADHVANRAPAEVIGDESAVPTRW